MGRFSFFQGILLTFVNLTPLSAFAVKGSLTEDVSKVRPSLCRLEPKFEITFVSRGHEPGRNQRVDGVCSAIRVINQSTLLTAKHCLLKNPGATTNLHSSENEFLSLDEMGIYCDSATQNYKPTQFKIHKKLDLAIIHIENVDSSKNPNGKPFRFATDLDFKRLRQSPEQLHCSSYGFGRNNSNEFRKPGGVKITQPRLLSLEESQLPAAIDYDFKNMSYYYASSMSNDINLIINKSSIPYLFREAQTLGLSETELKIKFKEFFAQLAETGLRPMDIYNPEFGPAILSSYQEYFGDLYAEAFGSFFDKTRLQLSSQGLPTVELISNTVNSTEEKSGIDSGDSGGPFTCEVNGELRLFGVHSMRMSSDLYSAKPWEPMYHKPKKRSTKNGISVPLTKPVVEWVINASQN